MIAHANNRQPNQHSDEAPKSAGLEGLYFSARTIAAALDVSRSYVRRLIKDGTLPSVRFGKSVRVSRAALADFIARAEAGEFEITSDEVQK